jgi:hypothetical protein
LPPEEAALIRLTEDDAPFVELLRQVQEPLREETRLASTAQVESAEIGAPPLHK